MTLNDKAFENIVGKGENAGNQHFLLFPPCLQPSPKKKFQFFSQIFNILSSANASNLNRLKFCDLVKS